MRMRHATPRCREAGEPLRFCRSFRHRGRTKRLNRFMKPATARPHGIGKNRHRGGPRVLSRGLIRVAVQAFACGVQKVFSIFPRAVDGVLPESPPLARVKFSQHASRSHYNRRCLQPTKQALRLSGRAHAPAPLASRQQGRYDHRRKPQAAPCRTAAPQGRNRPSKNIFWPLHHCAHQLRAWPQAHIHGGALRSRPRDSEKGLQPRP